MKNQVAPLEVGICVYDLPTMISFYTERLGFELISEIPVPAEKSDPGGFCAEGYTIVRLQSGRGERIKLVKSAGSPGARPQSDYVLHQQGGNFLTFIVSDLRAIVDELKANGNRILTRDDISEVRPGVYLSNICDPEGNILEFVEYEDLSSYRSDL